LPNKRPDRRNILCSCPIGGWMAGIFSVVGQ
jgi:hypothetical protein